MKDLSVEECLFPGIKNKAIENTKVTVYANGCAGLTKEKHMCALNVMESCQCEIIS